MTKIKADLTEVARKMMAGVVQIYIEGNLDENNQCVLNPAMQDTW